MTVSPQQRFTHSNPCPICGGWSALPAGHKRRCWGYLGDGGTYAHCTRSEFAGAIVAGPDGCYAHRLTGRCKCGEQHGPAAEKAPARRPAVTLHPRREVVNETVWRVGEFEHVRRDYNDSSKGFTWRGIDGSRGLGGVAVADLPLYGVDELPVPPAGQTVLVTEGERARDALTAAGALAVGTVTGAASCPSAAVLAPLAGYDVFLWPDNDDAGREHMQKVGAVLTASGTLWHLLLWDGAPLKGDAADFFSSGGTIAELAAMVDAAETRIPAPTVNGRESWIEVVQASTVTPEPITWVWRDHLARGKLTLLMGDPGLGKSLITQWMAAVVSTGGTWPDGERCEQGDAILFAVEDALADTIVPRLLAAAANTERVWVARGIMKKGERQAGRMFALSEHLAQLEALIAEKHATYVVLDPVSAYLGGSVHSHNEAEVRAVLDPLALLAERTGVTMVLVCHLNKGTAVQALYRAAGSIAFGAVCRLVLGVAPDDQDETGKRRLLLPIKQNIIPEGQGIGYRILTGTGTTAILKNAGERDQPPVLVWDDEPVHVDAASAMDRTGTTADRGLLAETREALREILRYGRLTANECKRQIKEVVGTTGGGTIVQARREIGVRVYREGYGLGGIWWWELPIDSKNLPKGSFTESMNQWESMGPAIDSVDSQKSTESTKSSIDSVNASIDSVNASGTNSHRFPLIPIDSASRAHAWDVSDPRSREITPVDDRESMGMSTGNDVVDRITRTGTSPRAAANRQPLCVLCELHPVEPGRDICQRCREMHEWQTREEEN